MAVKSVAVEPRSNVAPAVTGMRVASLHVHPLKSCAALDVDALTIEPRGPRHDRRWMLVDESARFLTARVEPRLVLIRATPDDGGLALSAPGCASMHVAKPAGAARIEVRVWNDHVDVACAAAAANAWLSEFMQRPVRLVYMDDRARRAIDPVYGTPGDEVSFADGYPLLAISEASLAALNERLEKSVGMERFRPNLVIGGGLAHAEDAWRRVRIDGIEFDAVKPCARCIFTTIDPVTAERDPAGEPLATLRSYRLAADRKGVLFGMNLIPRGCGTISLGAPVEVIDAVDAAPC